MGSRLAVWIALVVLATAAGAEPLAKFGGPAGCSATNCHGAPKPRDGGRTIHNEHTIWLTNKHAKSWAVLDSKPAKEIAEKLGFKEHPQELGRCLQCHALLVPPERQGTSFDIRAGNSCENCHGPSEKWISPHAKEGKKEWTHAQSVGAGMFDTLDISVRAAICVRCHLAIDHDMLAAGHPYLGFEVDRFSVRMPPHWKKEPPFHATKAWIAGQVLSLRDSLKQVDMRVKAKATEPYLGDSVAVAHGYYLTLATVAPALAPEAWPPIAKELAWLEGEVPTSPEQAAKAAAPEFQASLTAIAKTLGDKTYDATTNLAMMKDLAKATADVHVGGFRTAEQVYYAFDSLFRPYEEAAKPRSAKKLKDLIGELGKGIEASETGGWAPDAFIASLKKLDAELAKLK